MIIKIKKRDGRTVTFNIEKIAGAIYKAAQSVGKDNYEEEGEAQAIDMVQKAIAESIVKLNAANPNEQVIQLKSLEAFAKAADGKATKIIIPSEIQGIAGLATGLKEVMTDVKKPQ